MRSLSYRSICELDKALEDINKAIMLEPEDCRHYKSKGELYIRMGQYDNAIKTLQKAIDLNPNDSETLAFMGQCYQKLKQYEKALEYYNTSIKTNSKNYYAYFRLGCLYNELKQYKKAIKYFKISDNLSPNSIGLYSSLPAIYLKLNNYKKVVQYCTKIISITSSQKLLTIPEKDCLREAYLSRGDAYKHLEQYEKAIVDYSNALKTEPDNCRIYTAKAFCHKELKQYETALKHYDKAIELCEDKELCEIICNDKLDIYIKLEQFEKAIQLNPLDAFGKICESIPRFKVFLYYFVSKSKYLKIVDKYIKTYNYFLEFYKNNNEENTDLVKDVKEILASLYEMKAEVYKDLKYDKEARIELYKKALELDPKNKDAQKGLKELE